MAELMTPLRLSLLQAVAKHPDLHRAKLLTLRGVEQADLDFLEGHDLIREHALGCMRITHLGRKALERA